MLGRLGILLVIFLIFSAAVALRVTRLGDRPMHNDEGVNTLKFKDVWETGRFEYDPQEYHGPTLYYLTFPAVWLSRAKSFVETTEVTYRSVAAFFGLATLALALLLGRDAGWGSILWACAFGAVSPAMVFYSRYFIHEFLLVFFTFAAIVCGWKYFATRQWPWAIACGACLGLMEATKETWIIQATAGVVAMVLTYLWDWIWPDRHPLRRAKIWPMIAAVGVMLLVVVTFSTGFFTRPRGILDAVATYRTYVDRGSGGHIHDHPFNWYLSLLTMYQYPAPRGVRVNRNPVFSEAAIIVLAAIGFFIAMGLRRSPHLWNHPADAPDPPARQTILPLWRFLALYTLLLMLFYSAVPYKTPWCLLGFLQPMTMLAGLAASSLCMGTGWLACRAAGAASPRVRDIVGDTASALVGIVLLLALWQPPWRTFKNPAWPTSAAQALSPGWSLWDQSRFANSLAHPENPNFARWSSDVRNPWVYAHTVPDVFSGTKLMEEIASVHPLGHRLYGQVVTRDCWPLPWYLRRFDRLGYWTDLPLPATGQQPEPAVIIGPVEAWQQVQARAERGGPAYKASAFGLRPGVVLWVMVREPIWEKLEQKWRTKSSG